MSQPEGTIFGFALSPELKAFQEGTLIMGSVAPPENVGDIIPVTLSPSLVKALDQFIAEEAPGMMRSDAMREAFKQWAIDRGYINPNNIDQDLS